MRTKAPIILFLVLSYSCLNGQVPQSGLKIWFKSDAGIVSTGSNVSHWGDQSGNNNNAVQSGPTNPGYVQNAVNGRPAVSFNGTSQYFNLSYDFNGLTASSIFIVSSNQVDGTGGATNSENAALYWGAALSGGETFLTPFQTSIKYAFGTGQPGNIPVFTRNAGVAASFVSTCVIKDGAIETLYSGGYPVLVSTGKLAQLSGVSIAGYIGRGYNNTYFSGKIAEILVYNRALLPDERRSVENYLDSRYALGNIFVDSASPRQATDERSWAVTLTGANFTGSPLVKLRKQNEADISALSVDRISSSRIDCVFDCTGKTPGVWDIIIEVPGGASGILEEGFRIIDPVISGEPPLDNSAVVVYPNPSKGNSPVKIVNIPAGSSVSIHDISGNLIRRFSGADLSPLVTGGFGVSWDTTGPDGSPAASGTYFFSVFGGSGGVKKGKVLLIR